METARVTSAVDQAFISYFSTGPSTITIDGGRLALTYARRGDLSGGSVEAVTIGTYPIGNDFPYGEAFAQLRVNQSATSYTASLFVADINGDFQTYDASADGVVLTRDVGTMHLDAFEIANDDGVIAIEGGRAELDAVRLPPGVPTTLTRVRHPQTNADTGVSRLYFAFDADGAWRSTEPDPFNPSRITRGTWSATGDTLSVRTSGDSGSATTMPYGFQTTNSTLTLTQAFTACSDAACLERNASILGLRGALTAHQNLRVFEWERADPPPAP